MNRSAGILLAIAVVSTTVVCAGPKRAELIKGESTISYHMSHPLHEFDAVSHDAVYRVDVDPEKGEVTSVAAVVDVTTFDSGNSNRDSHAMEVIDAISYPEVRFVSSGISKTAADSVLVKGNLTFHGVTREIVIPAEVRWSTNRLDVHGAFDLSLTEFKIERPSLLMVPVSDAVKFTVAASFRW
jgi:polyisoprenoid-binding protein YceI